MRSALYYPSWGISDPRFMFESLLYWDHLRCIVPFSDFSTGADWPGMERESREFHNRFVRGLTPTPQEKTRVHDRLAGLLDTEPPDWFRADRLALDDASNLAVRKLSSRTVDMLCRHGWLVNQEADSMGKISKAAMGIALGTLAEEMSSAVMPAVTDNPVVFRASCNGLLRELQARQGLDLREDGFFKVGAPGSPKEAEMQVALAKVTRLGIEDREIDPRALRHLLRLREDGGFNEQRERFCERVDLYVNDLRRREPREHPTVHEHWEQELRLDRSALKRDLRSAGLKAIVERDGIVATGVAVAAGGGLLDLPGPVGWTLAIAVGGGGVLESARRRRAEVLDSHWSSWLMTTANPRPAGFGR